VNVQQRLSLAVAIPLPNGLARRCSRPVLDPRCLGETDLVAKVARPKAEHDIIGTEPKPHIETSHLVVNVLAVAET
jgi:hypothetical protein